MRNHARRLAPALAALTLTAAPAGADEVSGLRSEALVERSHRVDLRVDHGFAELVVKRTVFNGGKRHDQATFWLALPEEAVATGLRTLGEVDGKLTWFNADLMEAEAAAAKYRELTGIGGYYPKDPALLSWRHQGELALQVFPVAPSQPKTVAYTLAMPAHYKGGRYHVKLPAMGSASVPAIATASAASAADRLFVDGKPASSGTGISLDKGERDVALAWPSAKPVVGGLASIPVGRGRVLSRVHFEAAAKLSRVPEGAYVVVVLDASRSIDPLTAAGSVAAARAVLGHFPGAHVEVLTFDRQVHARHGHFVPVGQASADLAKLTLDLRNGSRIDDALVRADALLAAAPAGAARRIVAFTDLETRSELRPERVLPLLHSGALLHIGVMEGWGEPGVTRDDESPWAPVARANGGLVWQARAGGLADAEAMRKTYEEWARPVRIHHPGILAPGLTGALDLPETLDEGEGIEDMRINDGSVAAVTLTGELWSTPVLERIEPDDAEDRRVAALVFGAPAILAELDEREMMVLAQRGHAVSPVTSLLAVEPGVRPSTEGLELSGVGEGGGGSGEGIGLGGIGTIGHGSGSFDPQRFLRDAVAAGLRGCGGGGRKATVVLETTTAEVVDVPSVTVEGANNGALERCLSEAVWAVDLPSGFTARHASWTVGTS